MLFLPSAPSPSARPDPPFFSKGKAVGFFFSPLSRGLRDSSFGPPYEGVRGNPALKAPLTNWPRRLSRRSVALDRLLPYRNPVAQGFRGSEFFRLLANCSFLFFFAEQFFPDQNTARAGDCSPKKALQVDHSPRSRRSLSSLTSTRLGRIG